MLPEETSLEDLIPARKASIVRIQRTEIIIVDVVLLVRPEVVRRIDLRIVEVEVILPNHVIQALVEAITVGEDRLTQVTDRTAELPAVVRTPLVEDHPPVAVAEAQVQEVDLVADVGKIAN